MPISLTFPLKQDAGKPPTGYAQRECCRARGPGPARRGASPVMTRRRLTARLCFAYVRDSPRYLRGYVWKADILPASPALIAGSAAAGNN